MSIPPPKTMVRALPAPTATHCQANLTIRPPLDARPSAPPATPASQPRGLGGGHTGSQSGSLPPHCPVDGGGHLRTRRQRWLRTRHRAGSPDKAEVSGSSPLRPTHLTRGFAPSRTASNPAGSQTGRLDHRRDWHARKKERHPRTTRRRSRRRQHTPERLVTGRTAHVTVVGRHSRTATKTAP